MRRAFELDAARDDVPLAAGGTAFGFELVIFDGTTLDLFACPELAAEFGVPEGGQQIRQFVQFCPTPRTVPLDS